MPISSATLDGLAAFVAPAIDWLMKQLGALPAPAASDLGSVRSWLGGLTDGQLGSFLDVVPAATPVVAIARLELARALAPIAVVGIKDVPPPDRTILGTPHVDRLPIWLALKGLYEGDHRLLVIGGDPRRGKSHTVSLVRAVVDYLGPAHTVVAVDLEDRQSVESVAFDLAASLGDAVTLSARATTDSTGVLWAKTVAKQLFNYVRNKAGAGVTPWFVFDHFERMPPSSMSETFFNELAMQVATSRKQPTAPRLILIDHRTVPPQVEKFTLHQRVDRLTRDDLADYLVRRRPALTPADATDEAARMIQRSDDAAAEAGDANRFMDFLVVELEAFG